MTHRAIRPCELEAVRAHYDLGDLTAPPESGGGTANANLKIRTASGAYFLKRRNPKYAQPGFVAFDHALMEHLARYGVATPLALVSRQGRRWLEISGGVYELFPYHPGGAHDRHSAPQLAAAGRALALYHHAARDFVPPLGKDWPRYDDPRLIREGIEAIAPDVQAQLSSDEFGYLTNQVSVLERDLPDERYHRLPKLVVHGDYHPGNLKFLDNAVSGIFDLDWATLQPRVRDLADGIFLFAGERSADIAAADIWSLTQTWTPSPHRARIFMDAYLESETLDAEEVAALPLFVRARWLYCRVAGMAKVAPERHIGYFTSGLLDPLRALDRLVSLF